ncbi:hypothetical protein D9C01_12975, partial [Corynebacterium diphtheriae]
WGWPRRWAWPPRVLRGPPHHRADGALPGHGPDPHGDPAVPRRARQRLLLVVAALTMVVGVLGALAQTDIKRILSFILVSHIGYMIFGPGAGHADGPGRHVFYVGHHITVQTALFLVTGLI